MGGVKMNFELSGSEMTTRKPPSPSRIHRLTCQRSVPICDVIHLSDFSEFPATYCDFYVLSTYQYLQTFYSV